MNEYSFIVEFDEMSENQINKLWEYLSERNIKFHVLKDEDLKNENQKLKKQLKELEEHSANAINKQVARGINLINQQKEFIEYLEDYIDVLKNQQDGIEGLDIAEEHALMTLEEVLDKYKEISGLENE